MSLGNSAALCVKSVEINNVSKVPSNYNNSFECVSFLTGAAEQEQSVC